MLPTRLHAVWAMRCRRGIWRSTPSLSDDPDVREWPTVGSPFSDIAADALLRHIQVVGGSRQEWAALTEQQWHDRLADLGKVGDHAGASWLIIRPFEPMLSDGSTPSRSSGRSVLVRRTMSTGGCEVVADPEPSGRQRLIDAANRLHSSRRAITDETLTSALNEPAEVDPDLVLVLGAPTRLPGSLVWELAYSELVFLEVAWADLHHEHLSQAVSEFAHRHRRFGGLD
jgi:hypothetical protein